MTTARTLPALALPALALALALAAPPLAAQQTPEAPAPEAQDGWLPEIPGLDEMTDAAREAIERLREELGPALRQMREAVAMLDDYGPPEMLPNGDILIPRREGGAEAPENPDPDAGPQAPKAAPDTPAPAIDL